MTYHVTCAPVDARMTPRSPKWPDHPETGQTLTRWKCIPVEDSGEKMHWGWQMRALEANTSVVQIDGCHRETRLQVDILRHPEGS